MSSASDGDVHQHDVDLDSGLGDFSENPSPSSIANAAEGTADETHDAQTACVFPWFTTATHYIDCHVCRSTQLHSIASCHRSHDCLVSVHRVFKFSVL